MSDRARLESDRRYHVALDRSTLWRHLLDVPAYPARWPWLESFDGRALVAGEVWHCRVRSPLRLALRFDVRLGHVIPGERVTADIQGDLTGPATLTLADAAGGTELRLVSALVPRSATLAQVARFLPPVARWAHDHLVDTAFDQFTAPREPPHRRPAG